MKDILNRMTHPMNFSVWAFIFGFHSALTGLWLILPFEIPGQSYKNILPKIIFGLVMLVLGLILIAAAFTAKRILFVIGSNLGFYFWLITTLITMYINIGSAGWITALALSLYCGLVAVNLNVNKDDRYLT